MNAILLPFERRYILLTLAAGGTAASAALVPLWIGFAAPAAAFGALTLLGLRDITQKRHSILRNYPIAAHIRFLLEEIRPEIRQYFLEDETTGMPFARKKRSIVYQRAKGQLDKVPFGSQLDFSRTRHEWLNHSIAAAEPSTEPFRVAVGGPDCTQPYSASVFNISGMSFGALSANAIKALNKGAMLGGFAHDTGEGGVSPHHRKFGGDIIWQIGSGYFGCRNETARFPPNASRKLRPSPRSK